MAAATPWLSKETTLYSNKKGTVDNGNKVYCSNPALFYTLGVIKFSIVENIIRICEYYSIKISFIEVVVDKPLFIHICH